MMKTTLMTDRIFSAGASALLSPGHFTKRERHLRAPKPKIPLPAKEHPAAFRVGLRRRALDT